MIPIQKEVDKYGAFVTVCDALLHFFLTRDTFCFESTLKRIEFSAYNFISGDWNNFP